MTKQILRTLIENIVIEALEEWMNECECEDAAGNKTSVASFGGGSAEKKLKNNSSKKKKR